MTSLPVATNLVYVFAVFVISIVIAHLIFVYKWPLGKQGWRIAEYVWLLSASAALVGMTGEARKQEALLQREILNLRMKEAAYAVHIHVDGGSSDSVLCRPFFEKTYVAFKNSSPDEADRITVCSWLANIGFALQALPPDKILLTSLPTEPIALSSRTKLIVGQFRTLVIKNNDAVDAFQYVQNAAERSSFEKVWVIIAPFFLASALALRLSKVTGEMMLEKGEAAIPQAKVESPNFAAQDVVGFKVIESTTDQEEVPTTFSSKENDQNLPRSSENPTGKGEN